MDIGVLISCSVSMVWSWGRWIGIPTFLFVSSISISRRYIILIHGVLRILHYLHLSFPFNTAAIHIEKRLLEPIYTAPTVRDFQAFQIPTLRNHSLFSQKRFQIARILPVPPGMLNNVFLRRDCALT